MSEQRIIKFRGKVLGTWMEVTPDDDAWEQFWALVDRSTLGQFTGTKDRNGQEVYEGDIVKAVLIGFYHEREEALEEVIIDQDGHLAPFFMRVHCEEEWWKDCLADGFEVIGNIHEHSHLLT